MITPLQQYRSTTYGLTIQKLQKQADEQKNWLDEKLAQNVNKPPRRGRFRITI